MLLTLLKVGSVRFSAYYFASLITALHLTGRDSAGWIMLSATASVVGCLAIEWLNRVTDEPEDRINNAARCRLCDEIGYAQLRRLSVAMFVIVCAFGAAVWWITSRDQGVLLLIAVAVAVMINYSAGLRVKRWRWAVLFVLVLPFVFPFALAWAAFAPWRQFPAGVLFAPLFAFTISGAKDITDVTGDAHRRYHSVFVQLLRDRAAVGVSTRLLGMLLMPYAALVVLAAAHLAPARLLLLTVLLPFAIVYVTACRQATAAGETAVAREWLYHLLLVAELSTLFLLAPSATLALLLGGTAAFWCVASRFLHWRPGLTAADFAATARILDRSVERSAAGC